MEIKQLRIKFDAWQGVLHSVNTATDAGFGVKHEEFKKDLAKAEDMCRKVKMAVANVERNRVKFSHIDDRELNNRKAFVQGLENVRAWPSYLLLILCGHSCRPYPRLRAALSHHRPHQPFRTQAVAAMHETFHGRETQAKLDGDRKREMLSRQAVEVSAAGQRANAYNQANSGFMGDQQQAQSQIRREQDVTLDKMSNSLDRLGDMARAIDSELAEQDVIIADIDRGVDEAQGKMDATIKGVQKLLKTKDRCQLATIGILVLIFVIGELVHARRFPAAAACECFRPCSGVTVDDGRQSPYTHSLTHLTQTSPCHPPRTSRSCYHRHQLGLSGAVYMAQRVRRLLFVQGLCVFWSARTRKRI